MALRAVDSTLSGAIRALLPEADQRDRAAYLLALRLAEVIDESPDAETLKTMAPTLLSALNAIQATPKSRVAPKAEAVTASEPVSQLAKLRAAHGRNPASASN